MKKVSESWSNSNISNLQLLCGCSWCPTTHQDSAHQTDFFFHRKRYNIFIAQRMSRHVRNLTEAWLKYTHGLMPEHIITSPVTPYSSYSFHPLFLTTLWYLNALALPCFSNSTSCFQPLLTLPFSKTWKQLEPAEGTNNNLINIQVPEPRATLQTMNKQDCPGKLTKTLIGKVIKIYS